MPYIRVVFSYVESLLSNYYHFHFFMSLKCWHFRCYQIHFCSIYSIEFVLYVTVCPLIVAWAPEDVLQVGRSSSFIWDVSRVICWAAKAIIQLWPWKLKYHLSIMCHCTVPVWLLRCDPSAAVWSVCCGVISLLQRDLFDAMWSVRCSLIRLLHSLYAALWSNPPAAVMMLCIPQVWPTSHRTYTAAGCSLRRHGASEAAVYRWSHWWFSRWPHDQHVCFRIPAGQCHLIDITDCAAQHGNLTQHGDLTQRPKAPVRLLLPYHHYTYYWYWR